MHMNATTLAEPLPYPRYNVGHIMHPQFYLISFPDLLNVITDWLLDRRHCDMKWQTGVLEIREKINAAIQDMPPVDEISQLLSGTCMVIAYL